MGKNAPPRMPSVYIATPTSASPRFTTRMIPPRMIPRLPKASAEQKSITQKPSQAAFAKLTPSSVPPMTM